MTLFVPLWTPPGNSYAGGRYRAKEIIERLRGFNLEVLDTASSNIDGSSVRGTLRRLPFLPGVPRRGRLFAIGRIIDWTVYIFVATFHGLLTRHPMVVYVPYSELLPVALVGILVARIRRSPLIFCNLNIAPPKDRLSRIVWKLSAPLQTHADGLITISTDLARELKSFGIKSPIQIGLVGVHDKSVDRGVDKYIGLFVGRHSTEKGVYDAISIWPIVLAAIPNARLALVGPYSTADHERILTCIRELKCEPYIDVYGAVDEERKWELYSISRVCVFPSRVEGWGLVPIEALLARCHVVAYDLPVYRETIAGLRGVTLVSVGDLEALADATIDATITRDFPSLPPTFPDWDRAARREEELIHLLIDGLPA